MIYSERRRHQDTFSLQITVLGFSQVTLGIIGLGLKARIFGHGLGLEAQVLGFAVRGLSLALPCTLAVFIISLTVDVIYENIIQPENDKLLE